MQIGSCWATSKGFQYNERRSRQSRVVKTEAKSIRGELESPNTLSLKSRMKIWSLIALRLADVRRKSTAVSAIAIAAIEERIKTGEPRPEEAATQS